MAHDVATMSNTSGTDWIAEYAPDLPDFLTFRDGPFGFSCFATKDIPADTPLLQLKYNNIMSEKYALSTSLGAQVYELFRANAPPLESPSRLALYCVMIQQKLSSPSERFSSYLRSLPATYDDPLWWNEGELAWLEHTNAVDTVRVKKNWLTEAVALLSKHLTDLPQTFRERATYENILWAHSSFTSRAFPHSLSQIPEITSEDDVDYTGCLLPALDILNHKPRTPISWIRHADYLSFVTHAAITAGEEIFNNYGPKSNGELLVGYGFVIPSNPFDIYTVKLGCSVATGKEGTASTAGRTFHCHVPSSSAPLDCIPLSMLGYALCLQQGTSISGADADEELAHRWENSTRVSRSLSACLLLPLFLNSMKRLPSVDAATESSSRSRRRDMASVYVGSQQDILLSAAKQLVDIIASSQGTPYSLELQDDCKSRCAQKDTERIGHIAIVPETSPAEGTKAVTQHQWLVTKPTTAGDFLLILPQDRCLSVAVLVERFPALAELLQEEGIIPAVGEDDKEDGVDDKLGLALLLLAEWSHPSSPASGVFLGWAFNSFSNERREAWLENAACSLGRESTELTEFVEFRMAQYEEQYCHLRDIQRDHKDVLPRKLFTKANIYVAMWIVDALSVQLYHIQPKSVIPMLPQPRARPHPPKSLSDVWRMNYTNVQWITESDNNLVLQALCSMEEGTELFLDFSSQLRAPLLGLIGTSGQRQLAACELFLSGAAMEELLNLHEPAVLYANMMQ